jgi:cyclopropane fatty-acyl-phospholipid synthase-like methyltransferase
MADWVSFFDSDHSIYVNARHRDVHALLVADGLSQYIPSPDATVLDYGCGEALYAERLAAQSGRLILCEAAPHLRANLAARCAGNQKIIVLSPQQVATLGEGSIDLIIMHSVAQYLTPAELDGLLGLFRNLLHRNGNLVLGDIVQPQVSALSDAVALLRFAFANGFFFAAFKGLLRTLLSDYWRLRQSRGLTRYREDQMLAKFRAAGFSAQRATRNIGHLQRRMTFVAGRAETAP